MGRLLPTHIGIGRGHVASPDWSTASEEIDIILYDRRYAAGFPYLGEPGKPGEHLGVFSSTAVLGCIAVTKTLTKRKLKSSIDNLQTATKLITPDMVNQLHFDMPLTGALRFRNGSIVNPTITAVVAFSDQIFTETSKGHRSVITSDRKLDLKLDSLATLDGFCGGQLDMIYTVDGIIMYPMIPGPTGFTHAPPEQWVGKPKGCVEVEYENGQVSTTGADSGDPPILLFEDHRLDEPAVSLRLFLTHLIHACSWIVKQTPDFSNLIGDAEERKARAPFLGRRDAEALAMAEDGVAN